MSKLRTHFPKAVTASLIGLFTFLTQETTWDVAGTDHKADNLSEEIAEQGPRILVTGFKPWNDHPYNISEEMIDALKEQTGLSGNVDFLVTEVDFKSVDDALEQACLQDYDYIIATGMANRSYQSAKGIVRETKADDAYFYKDPLGNCADGFINDSGYCFNSEKPDVLYDKSAMAELYEAYAKTHGCDLSTSLDKDSGDGLCEYIQFSLMEKAAEIREQGGDTEVMFFHLYAHTPEAEAAKEDRAREYAGFFKGFVDHLQTSFKQKPAADFQSVRSIKSPAPVKPG